MQATSSLGAAHREPGCLCEALELLTRAIPAPMADAARRRAEQQPGPPCVIGQTPLDSTHACDLSCCLQCWPASKELQDLHCSVLLQAFNPPLVHGVTVACPQWARQLGRLVAVARGDGVVAVYDADQAQQPPQHRKPSKVRLLAVLKQ